MKVYVFGNQDVPEDNVTLTLAKKLSHEINDVEFEEVKPNEDLPFAGEKNVVIMDVIFGIKKPMILQEKDFDKLKLPPRSSVHDFDLGFQLKYLKKIGKLGKLKIIGIPMSKKINDANYKSIHSMVKKLVAQDMQGS